MFLASSGAIVGIVVSVILIVVLIYLISKYHFTFSIIYDIV